MMIDRPEAIRPPGPESYVIRRFTAILFLLSTCAGLPGQAVGGLSAPTGVDASDGAYATKVGVAWDVIRNATIYEVFRGVANDAAYAAS